METATATVRVCGRDTQATVAELDLSGLAEDIAVGTLATLPRLVNLRTLILSSRRFTDEGWAELMTALRECPRLGRLEMVGCGLGPKHAGDLADILSDATQFIASLVEVNMAGAIIGESGPALVEAVKKSPSLEFITIGKGSWPERGVRLPLKGNYDSNVFDASGRGIELGGVAVIAWWLTTFAAAAVARLILNENPLTGGRRSTDFDTDITGITALCDTLKTSSVTELGLAKCRLGPGSLGKLAEYVRDADAALTKIDVRNNTLDGDSLETLKVATSQGCEILCD